MKNRNTAKLSQNRIKKLNKILFKDGYVPVIKEEKTEFLIVIIDEEIYMFTPNDAIPFYYNYYSKIAENS